jgi:hypothetical protein
MNADLEFLDLGRLTPNTVEQLSAGEHSARLLEENFKQPKLRWTEMDIARASAHPPRLAVEVDVARIQMFGDALRAAAA